MSFLGGIMKSVINPATLMQLAMGPAGWASLAMRTIGTAIAQQVIQQLGQQFGLPPAVISMAQQAFATASGTQGMPNNITDAVSQLAGQFNLSPSQQGELQRGAEDSMNSLISQLGQSEETKEAISGGKGQSLLMKIAIALGKLLDKKMTEMAGLTDQIGKLGSGSDKQSKLGELTGKLQGLGQEVSMLSNALTNTIKSIGEANTTIARKG
jgi:hypothetical protein